LDRRVTRGAGSKRAYFFGWRPALKRLRKALVVIAGFSGSETDGRRVEVSESLAPPKWSIR